MTTNASRSTDQVQTSARRSLLVGVDPGGRSVSAVVWAVEEAERRGASLTLVSATRGHPSGDDLLGEHDLTTHARRLTMLEVDQRAVPGNAVDVLLGAAEQADTVVLGCRTMRPAHRLVVGSTSRAVASWSPAPVVIVPESWMRPSMATGAVVAGVRPEGSAQSARTESADTTARDEEVLGFASSRAAALRVPLLVVAGFEPGWLQAWSPPDVDAAREELESALGARLTPWRERYPELEIVESAVAEPADTAVLEAARSAQLVVVGRHHSRTLNGRLGGTARGVLNGATCPVAVIPSGDRATLRHELRTRRTEPEPSWGPMF